MQFSEKEYHLPFFDEYGYVRKKCPKCGDTKLVKDKEEPLLDYYVKLAEASNAQVEIISTETTEGAQLLELGGIGAILRY